MKKALLTGIAALFDDKGCATGESATEAAHHELHNQHWAKLQPR